MLKRKPGRPAKQMHQPKRKMSKKIDENGNVPIIIDENTEPLINEAESAIKQFLKDAGNEEFDVERLKNEEITKIDLTTIVDEWKHDMELRLRILANAQSLIAIKKSAFPTFRRSRRRHLFLKVYLKTLNA